MDKKDEVALGLLEKVEKAETKEKSETALGFMLIRLANQVEHCRKCKKDKQRNITEYCPKHQKVLDELERQRRKYRLFTPSATK